MLELYQELVLSVWDGKIWVKDRGSSGLEEAGEDGHELVLC